MNWSRGLSNQPGSRYVRPLTVAAASVAACSAVVVWKRQELPSFRPRLNNTVIEAVSGAVGEVAQIALLYPLDTIKVRCQANSCSTTAILAQIAAQSKGNLLAALALLYAGAIPAAATSILVGSVHYVCFCATKRAVLNLPGFSSNSGSTSSTAGSSSTAAPAKSSNDSAAPAKVATATPAAPAAAGVSGDEEVEQQPSTTTIIMSHGLTGSHFHLVQECEPDTQQLQEAAASAASTTSTSSAAPAVTASAAASAAGATPAGGVAAAAAAATAATSSEEGAAADADGRMAANVLSAILTAAITALVEAPLELFRHNSQAGQCQANFVAEMWRSMRKDGPKSLYYGFLPYCFEAWPYDITELLVVGGLKDSRAELASKPGLLGAAVAAAPPQLYDLSVGAVAGTAAVLVSMPFDCVKTYMQTHGQALGGSSGMLGSVGAFWATGRDMVARKGPGALYVGLLPRLMHQVPGAMVCWWAIEGCHRHLQQFHYSYAVPQVAPEAAAAG